MKKYQRKLLSVSSPRSGTRFLATVLKNCGIKIGHELMHRDGTVSGYFAVEDCWYPGKHWNDEDGFEDESRQRRSDYEFEQVWHTVRDPRRVIPSLASNQLGASFWCWQERNTGISVGLYPKLLRGMLFWVAWNELIEKNEEIDLFFRIEDIDTYWGDICQRLGIEDHHAVPPIPRDYGTVETGPRRSVPMSWEDMEAIDRTAAFAVRAMAERYGYTEDL